MRLRPNDVQRTIGDLKMSYWTLDLERERRAGAKNDTKQERDRSSAEHDECSSEVARDKKLSHLADSCTD